MTAENESGENTRKGSPQRVEYVIIGILKHKLKIIQLYVPTST